MNSRSSLFLALGFFLLFAVPHQARADCVGGSAQKPGEIYLLRGLANIFSLGLDNLQSELTANGFRSCVFNHSRWKEIANDLIARQKSGAVSYPVIIIGHSLGADAAPMLATQVARAGVPVRYVVMMDPVVPTRVGGPVAQIDNYYIPKPKKNKILMADKDFRGKLNNIDVGGKGVDHFDIDKDPRGHRLIMQNVANMIAEQQKPVKASSKKK